MGYTLWTIIVRLGFSAVRSYYGALAFLGVCDQPFTTKERALDEPTIASKISGESLTDLWMTFTLLPTYLSDVQIHALPSSKAIAPVGVRVVLE